LAISLYLLNYKPHERLLQQLLYAVYKLLLWGPILTKLIRLYLNFVQTDYMNQNQVNQTLNGVRTHLR
jgi:hypothetical protein